MSLRSWQTDRSKYACFKTRPHLSLQRFDHWFDTEWNTLICFQRFLPLKQKTPPFFKNKYLGVSTLITSACHQQHIPAFTSSHTTTHHRVQVKHPQYYPKQHRWELWVSKWTLCLPGPLCKTRDYVHYRNNPIQTWQWRVHWRASPLSDSTGWAAALLWVHLEQGRK